MSSQNAQERKMAVKTIVLKLPLSCSSCQIQFDKVDAFLAHNCSHFKIVTRTASTSNVQPGSAAQPLTVKSATLPLTSVIVSTASPASASSTSLITPTASASCALEWDHNAVLVLVDAYRTFRSLLACDSHQKIAAWKKIAGVMRSKGYPFSWGACAKKMKAFQCRYKNIVSSPSSAAKTGQKWKYFSIMKDLLAYYPKVQRSAILAQNDKSGHRRVSTSDGVQREKKLKSAVTEDTQSLQIGQQGNSQNHHTTESPASLSAKEESRVKYVVQLKNIPALQQILKIKTQNNDSDQDADTIKNSEQPEKQTHQQTQQQKAQNPQSFKQSLQPDQQEKGQNCQPAQKERKQTHQTAHVDESQNFHIVHPEVAQIIQQNQSRRTQKLPSSEEVSHFIQTAQQEIIALPKTHKTKQKATQTSTLIKQEKCKEINNALHDKTQSPQQTHDVSKMFELPKYNGIGMQLFQQETMQDPLLTLPLPSLSVTPPHCVLYKKAETTNLMELMSQVLDDPSQDPHYMAAQISSSTTSALIRLLKLRRCRQKLRTPPSSPDGSPRRDDFVSSERVEIQEVHEEETEAEPVPDSDDQNKGEEMEEQKSAEHSPKHRKQPKEKNKECEEEAVQLIPVFSDQDFKHHFRMSRSSVQELCRLLDIHIGNIHVSIERKVLATLWLLGNKESFRETADRFHFSKGSLHVIMYSIFEALKIIRSDIIVWPQRKELGEIAAGFQNVSGVPGVVGVLGITHIRIPPPSELRESYLNRQGHPSIQLQAVCDSSLRFLDIYTGYPGSVDPEEVFKNSPLSTILDNGNLPEGYHILASSTYTLRPYLMVPFFDNGCLMHSQIRFNQSLAAALAHIDQCFHLLKSKFRRIQKLDLRAMDKTAAVISGACVLYNFILKREGCDGDELEDIEVEEQGTPEVEMLEDLADLDMPDLTTEVSDAQAKRMELADLMVY